MHGSSKQLLCLAHNDESPKVYILLWDQPIFKPIDSQLNSFNQLNSFFFFLMCVCVITLKLNTMPGIALGN